jgi:hypothetical protein
MQNISDFVLAKINDLKNWQASIVLLLVGVVVYSNGLVNPFEGDDNLQILNNPPVHSISHIILFFKGGTFYAGQGASAALIGHYYRPLMTATFSLIYTIFGPHAFYFHALQLLLCIGSAVLLYLVFQYSFNRVLSLSLAIIFLIHPIDSQNVYAIPNMQDSLFFFFGILALYFLVRFKSFKSIWFTTVCLLVSLLAKETAVLFIIMCFLYLAWRDRKRLIVFTGSLVVPVALYLSLRVRAIGLLSSQNSSPIDTLTFVERLMTVPSIILFYFSKVIFPFRLASTYEWVEPRFTIDHVLIPVVIDLLIAVITIYLGFLIRVKSSKTHFFTYLFFSIWTAIGFALIVQFLPLDMTASESWFYFPMAGMLGMVGSVLIVYHKHIQPTWFLLIVVLLIGIYGTQTFERSFDWRSQNRLAYADIKSSPSDFIAYDLLAEKYNRLHDYRQAKLYAEHSVAIYSSAFNNNDLGVAFLGLRDYQGALNAYQHGLNQGAYIYDVENLATLYAIFYNNSNASQFYELAIKTFPTNSDLWMYMAIWDAEHHNSVDAKLAITRAGDYGVIPAVLTNAIMNNQPLTITISNLDKSIIL